MRFCMWLVPMWSGNMKHDDLALVDLDEAIRLAPDSIDAYLLRGDIYLDQKKKSLAKADFEKAISLGVPLPMFTNRCNNANNPEK